ncbi:putative ankyrin repeat protein RF_0381 [Ptychodera flava]|uniref:putative ankyrin repeat protein RF_0381 n=1 Tax=Ptychodera flava TaxID=63121 RepID=UPI003969D816
MVYNQESTGTDDAEKHKCTTLQYAVKECAPLSTFNHLISKGASVNVCDTVGRNALHWAAEHSEGHPEIVRRVCECISDVNAEDKKLKTPLYVAAECRNVDAVKYLLANNANVKKYMDEKTAFPPVYAAAQMKKVPIIKVFQKAEVDINKRFKSKNPQIDGLTPIQLACKVGDMDALKTLIDAGAEVNAKNESGETALHSCCSTEIQYSELEKIMLYLVDQKIAVNAITKKKETPLHTTLIRLKRKAEYPLHKVVKFLLSSGASIAKKDSDENSVLDLLLEIWNDAVTCQPKESVLCLKILFEAGGYITLKSKESLRRLSKLGYIFIESDDGTRVIDPLDRSAAEVVKTALNVKTSPGGSAPKLSLMAVDCQPTKIMEIVEDYEVASLIVGNIQGSELNCILSRLGNKGHKVGEKLIVFSIKDFDNDRFFDWINGTDISVFIVNGCNRHIAVGDRYCKTL